MQGPNFSKFEFLAAATFNSAAASVSGNINASVSGIAAPGLIHPESLVLTPSGLAVTVSAPLPFQVMFGDGHVAAASGTVTNQTTTSYSVNFSGSVPASGAAVTAYLNVAAASIQLQPYQVIGPQPGHPDYNPNFVPYTAYAVNVDSLNFTAGTVAADGLTTFEVGRATLASGAASVTLNTAYQQRCAGINASQVVQIAGAVSITALVHGGRTMQWTASGTATLPAVAGSNGVFYTFASQTSGTCVIQVSGSDQIYGTGTTGGGVSSFTLGQNGAITFEGVDGVWQASSVSPNLTGGILGLTDGGGQTANFNVAVGFIYDCDVTGGTFTATIASAAVVRSSTFAINKIGTNTFLTVNWNGLNYVGDPTNTQWNPEGLIVFRYSGNAARGWERSL